MVRAVACRAKDCQFESGYSRDSPVGEQCKPSLHGSRYNGGNPPISYGDATRTGSPVPYGGKPAYVPSGHATRTGLVSPQRATSSRRRLRVQIPSGLPNG